MVHFHVTLLNGKKSSVNFKIKIVSFDYKLIVTPTANYIPRCIIHRHDYQPCPASNNNSVLSCTSIIDNYSLIMSFSRQQSRIKFLSCSFKLPFFTEIQLCWFDFLCHLLFEDVYLSSLLLEIQLKTITAWGSCMNNYSNHEPWGPTHIVSYLSR